MARIPAKAAAFPELIVSRSLESSIGSTNAFSSLAADQKLLIAQVKDPA